MAKKVITIDGVSFQMEGVEPAPVSVAEKPASKHTHFRAVMDTLFGTVRPPDPVPQKGDSLDAIQAAVAKRNVLLMTEPLPATPAAVPPIPLAYRRTLMVDIADVLGCSSDDIVDFKDGQSVRFDYGFAVVGVYPDEVRLSANGRIRTVQAIPSTWRVNPLQTDRYDRLESAKVLLQGMGVPEAAFVALPKPPKAPTQDRALDALRTMAVAAGALLPPRQDVTGPWSFTHDGVTFMAGKDSVAAYRIGQPVIPSEDIPRIWRVGGANIAMRDALELHDRLLRRLAQANVPIEKAPSEKAPARDFNRFDFLDDFMDETK